MAGSARQALVLAAHQQSQKVNSLSENMSVRMPSGHMSGTTQLRIKPLLLHASVHLSVAGQNLPVNEIVNGKAIYLHMSLLTREIGKPWLEIPFSSLGKNGSSLQQLFQNIQNENPVMQTRMFATAKHVRKVGAQTINGVPTTEYQGSFTPSGALAALPHSLRKLASPAMKTISGTIRFKVWIDAQHLTRKADVVETVQGQTVATTVTVTSINQPIHVTLPPASQVATAPKGSLGNTGL